MLQTSDVASVMPQPDGRRERYLSAFRWMLLARVFEEKLASLYRGGKVIGGVFLSKGQEALSAALGVALRKGDIYAPLIRDAAGRFAFGESMLDAALATRFADAMLLQGVYVVGFSFPVVPQGRARIRTQISAAHSREDLEFAVGAFARVKQELGL